MLLNIKNAYKPFVKRGGNLFSTLLLSYDDDRLFSSNEEPYVFFITLLLLPKDLSEFTSEEYFAFFLCYGIIV